MVKTETQIAVVKDNFDNIRLYKNGNGELCVDVSAVSLPKELVNAGWELNVAVAPLHVSGSSMGDGGWYLGSGESVVGHIIKDGNPRTGYETIKISDFSKVMVSMSLYHKDYTKNDVQIVFRSVSDTSNVITGFYVNASQNMKNENINMDVSGIYKGIK